MRIQSLLQANIQGRARKRSKKSYPMEKSGKIPGTNIQHNQGLSGVKNVARQGRMGDSTLRNVGGVPSHVNKKEAQVIDSLGPLGEAWVKNVGSGTINPKTGLPEYWGFVANIARSFLPESAYKMAEHHFTEGDASGAWRPAQGNWGIFGKTAGAKAREREEKLERIRQESYKQYVRENKETDFATLSMQDHDNLGKTIMDFRHGAPGGGGGKNWGIGMDQDDWDLYIDKYDTRQEEETEEKLERGLEQSRLGSDASAEQGQEGLFGLLTQSQQAMGQSGFAGGGGGQDFAMDFKEDALMDKIGNTQQQEQLEREDLKASAESHVKNIREDYNEQFWDQMDDFNTTKAS